MEGLLERLALLEDENAALRSRPPTRWVPQVRSWGGRAVAFASWLGTGLGISEGKIAQVLGQLGVDVTAGWVTQAVARAGCRAQPTNQALVDGV